MFNLNILILAMCVVANAASIIRTSAKDYDVMKNFTATDILTTTMESELNTIKDQYPTVTTTERLGTISRDEEATIWIADETLLDSENAELIKQEAQTVDLEKSSKLLLLSTSKIAEKPKQPDENFDEDEEPNEMVENVAQIAVETTTVFTIDEETTTSSNVDADQTTKNHLARENQADLEDIKNIKSEIKFEENQLREASMLNLATTGNITKLYPINDTLYADNKQKFEYESKESVAPFAEYQHKEALNANPDSLALEESESDYVLVESDLLEGSYTDVDSDLYLQPIVQSVEIVPSSLDDTLLTNYAQSW